MLFKSSLIAAVYLSLRVIHAHMQVMSPTPRCDKNDTQCPFANIDYTYTAPIGTHDSISQPLCKHPTPENPTVTWTAGQSVTVELAGSAPHDGGWCQLAISYDLSNSPGSFVRIGDPFPNCPISTLSLTVTLPSNLPASTHAVGSWIWNNKMGNREMYMNCFDIKINGPSSDSFTGPAAQFFNYGPSSQGFDETDADMAKLGTMLHNAPTITVPCSGGAGVPAPNTLNNSSAAPTSSTQQGMPSPYASPSMAPLIASTGEVLPTDTTSSVGTYPTAEPSTTDTGSPSPYASSSMAPLIASTGGVLPTDTTSSGGTYPTAEPSTTDTGSSQPALSNVPGTCASSYGPVVCTDGMMQCVDDTTFFTCDHGNAWVPRMCAPGTKCMQNGNAVMCG